MLGILLCVVLLSLHSHHGLTAHVFKVNHITDDLVHGNKFVATTSAPMNSQQTLCLPGQKCNLRAALRSCQAVLASDEPCEVHLAPNSEHEVDVHDGDFMIWDTSHNRHDKHHHVVIRGSNARIRAASLSEDGNATQLRRGSHRFFSHITSKQEDSSGPTSLLRLEMHSLTLEGFGHSELDGGVLQIQGAETVHLLDVHVVDAVGQNGGALHISDTKSISITNSSFYHVRASAAGGAISLNLGESVRLNLENVTVDSAYAKAGTVLNVKSHTSLDPIMNEISIHGLQVSLSESPMSSLIDFEPNFFTVKHPKCNIRIKDVELNFIEAESSTINKDFIRSSSFALFQFENGISTLMLQNINMTLPEPEIMVFRDFEFLRISDVPLVSLSQLHLSAYTDYNVTGINVANVQTLAVTNSRFFRLSSSTSGGAMSLLNVSVVTIDQCHFIDNVANGDTSVTLNGGGAIYAKDISQFTCSDSEFLRNEAPLGVGGAIMVVNTVYASLISSFVWFNKAYLDGGAVYSTDISATMTMDRTIFLGNQITSAWEPVAKGGAVYINRADSLYVIDCQYQDNSASSDGGGLYASNIASVTISETYFTNNYGGGHGGGFAADTITTLLTIKNITLDGNRGNDSSSHGGGMYIAHTKLMGASNLVVLDNFAAKNGGGIYLHQVIDSVFKHIFATGNVAGKNGGVLYGQQGTSLVLRYVNASENQARDVSGGALYVQNYDYCTALFLDLISNKANVFGGALVMALMNSVNIYDSSFVSNQAGSSGGAVRFSDIDGGGLYHIKTSQIIDNVALGTTSGGSGGGVSVSNVNFMEMDTVFVQGNKAMQSSGGGISVDKCSSVYVWFSEFHTNSARLNGGAVSVKNAVLSTIVALDLTHNTAQQGDGGAVYVSYDEGYGSISNVANVDGRHNTAGGSGGAMFFSYIQMLSINGLRAYKNTASAGNGGALYIERISEQGTFDAFNITSNTAAAGQGGGVAIMSAPTMRQTWQRNIITGNTAGGSGGGVYINSAVDIYMYETQLFSNQASAFGGGLFVSNIPVFLIDKMTAQYNQASMGGGMHVETLATTAQMDFALDNVFDSNRAYAGGAMSFGRTRAFYTVNVQYQGRMIFTNNAAQYGSVLYAVEYGLHTRPWYLSDVSNNVASEGGTFFFLIHKNVVSNITSGNTMVSPLDIDPDTTSFSGNTALYGLLKSSQVISFQGPTLYNAIPDGNDLDKPIIFSNFRDYFNQSLPDDVLRLATPITSYDCSGVVPAVSTGGEDGRFVNGSVSYRRTSIGCARGGHVHIQFTIAYRTSVYPDALSLLSPAVVSNAHVATVATRVHFRTCVTGERTVGTRCTPCGNGEFSFGNATDTCQSCATMRGVRGCQGQTLELRPGYWRYDENTLGIIPCWTQEACIGGSETGDALCREGYEGPACGICSVGYFSNGRKCKRCEPKSQITGGILLLIALIVFSLFIVALYVYRKKIRIQTLSAILVYLRQSYPKLVTKLKVLLATFQIIANIPVTLQVQLPSLFIRYLTSLEFFNLNFGVMFPFACAVSLDYMQFLLLVTLIPIGLSLLLMAGYLFEGYGLRWLFPIRYLKSKYASSKNPVSNSTASTEKDSNEMQQQNTKNKTTSYQELHQFSNNGNTTAIEMTNMNEKSVVDTKQDAFQSAETTNGDANDANSEIIDQDYGYSEYLQEQENFRRIRTRYLNAWFYLSYLVLPAATTTIFQVFNCTDIDPYQENAEVLQTSRFLTADMRISCESSYYKSWIPYTIAMIAVYPIGIPLAYYLVLYSHRKEIATRDVVAEQEHEAWLYQQVFAKQQQQLDPAEDVVVVAQPQESSSEESAKQKVPLSEEQKNNSSMYDIDYEQVYVRKASDFSIQNHAKKDNAKVVLPDVELGLQVIIDDDHHYQAKANNHYPHVNTNNSSNISYISSQSGEIHAPAAALAMSYSDDEDEGDARPRGSTADINIKNGIDKNQKDTTNIKVGNTGSDSTEKVAFTGGYLSTMSPEVMGIAFLWSAYEPRFWYWEVIETLRRIMLTAVIAIISPGTPLQSILSILFAIAFLQLYGVFAPYEDDEDDALANIGQIQVFLTFFAALIVQNQLLSQEWFNLLGILLIAVNVSMYALPFYFLGKRVESMARVYRRQQQLLKQLQSLDNDSTNNNNGNSNMIDVDALNIDNKKDEAKEDGNIRTFSNNSLLLHNADNATINRDNMLSRNNSHSSVRSYHSHGSSNNNLHNINPTSSNNSNANANANANANTNKRLARYRSDMSMRIALEMERTGAYHTHHKQRYRNNNNNHANYINNSSNNNSSNNNSSETSSSALSPAALRAFSAIQSMMENPLKQQNSPSVNTNTNTNMNTNNRSTKNASNNQANAIKNTTNTHASNANNRVPPNRQHSTDSVHL